MSNSTYTTLSAFERWMVHENLETIRSMDVILAEQVALLQAHGYPRIAQAVEEISHLPVSQWPRPLLQHRHLEG